MSDLIFTLIMLTIAVAAFSAMTWKTTTLLKERRRSRSRLMQRGESSDPYITVNLTAGPYSRLGRRELYRLRPGDPLWLEHADYSGIERVKVYSGGYMVGELMLIDAEQVINLMETSRITASFVSRQNSSLSGHIVDLEIRVHYRQETKKKPTVAVSGLKRLAPYIVSLDVPGIRTFFQN